MIVSCGRFGTVKRSRLNILSKYYAQHCESHTPKKDSRVVYCSLSKNADYGDLNENSNNSLCAALESEKHFTEATTNTPSCQGPGFTRAVVSFECHLPQLSSSMLGPLLNHPQKKAVHRSPKIEELIQRKACKSRYCTPTLRCHSVFAKYVKDSKSSRPKSMLNPQYLRKLRSAMKERMYFSNLVNKPNLVRRQEALRKRKFELYKSGGCIQSQNQSTTESSHNSIIVHKIQADSNKEKEPFDIAFHMKAKLLRDQKVFCFGARSPFSTCSTHPFRHYKYPVS